MICPTSKLWWNANIKEKRKVVGREDMNKMEFGGSHLGDGRAPEVNSVVQEPNVKLLPAEPKGS